MKLYLVIMSCSKEALVTTNHGFDTSNLNHMNTSYTSMIQNLNAILFEKQMNLLKWVESRIKLDTPALKLFMAMVIFFPETTANNAKGLLGIILNQIRKLYNLFSRYYKTIYSLITRKQINIEFIEPAEIHIVYITNISINNLYKAMDWYLKTTKINNDDKPDLLSVTDKIEASRTPKEYNLLVDKPDSTSNSIVHLGKVINWKKSSFVEKFYSSNGGVDKNNFKIVLTSDDMTKKELLEFCKYVCNAYAKSQVDLKWVQKVYKIKNGSTWDSQPLPFNRRKIDTITMRGGMERKIVERVREFINKEEWYIEKGLPFIMNMMFYGPPGTGKTSMIKAISYMLKRHVYYLNLNNVRNDHDFEKLMNSINVQEAIVVFEDIDGMSDAVRCRDLKEVDRVSNFEHENKVSKRGEFGISTRSPTDNNLCLSTILNHLDGINARHGMISIMTTNKIETLDKALFRDGRVDEKIYFGYIGPSEVVEMFTKFYDHDHGFVTKDFRFIKDIAPSTVEKCLKKNIRYSNMAIEALKEEIGIFYTPAEVIEIYKKYFPNNTFSNEMFSFFEKVPPTVVQSSIEKETSDDALMALRSYLVDDFENDDDKLYHDKDTEEVVVRED